MSAEPEGLPRTPREWATLYLNERESLATRQLALAALTAGYADEMVGGGAGEAGTVLAEILSPEVQRVARLVAPAATASEREEFVLEAPTLILAPRQKSTPPRICRFRPEEGPLGPWLQRVLKNCWIDRTRRSSHLMPLAQPDTVLDSRSLPEDESELLETLTVPFSPADLMRAADWGPRWRVELLCLAGLWAKVPSLLWETWLQDYESDCQVTFDRPFPPEQFLAFDDPASRTAPLAKLLRYPRANTLSVRWNRGHHKLDQLQFVRDLRGC